MLLKKGGGLEKVGWALGGVRGLLQLTMLHPNGQEMGRRKGGRGEGRKGSEEGKSTKGAGSDRGVHGRRAGVDQGA